MTPIQVTAEEIERARQHRLRETLWCVMPVLAGPELTLAAIADVLAQSIPTRLLIINQGVDDAFRLQLERIAEAHADRIFVWSHMPPLPSLAATWNRALDFVWATGGEAALVVNNDVRLHRQTAEVLTCAHRRTEALFVTAVGVTVAQFDPAVRYHGYVGKQPAREGDAAIVTTPTDAEIDLMARGGPDFSCFLISREAHQKYRFDDAFVPAYGEDCDLHRRYMLSGDGDKIFSINLPYHHVDHGSGTLKSLPPGERSALERRLGQSRAYYARKWGGGINHETFTIPFDAASAQAGVTNPELQRAILQPAEETDHDSSTKEADERVRHDDAGETARDRRDGRPGGAPEGDGARMDDGAGAGRGA